MAFLQNLAKKAKERASQVYDQANVFDNGLSYQTRQVNPANANKSVLQQANQQFVQPVTNVAQKSLNTGTALGAGILGGTNVAKESVFGTDQSYKNALAATTSTVDEFLRSGLGGKGGYLTPEQSKTRGDGLAGFKKNIAAPVAQGVADIAPLVLPIGAIGQTGKLGARVAKQAAINAGVGGATDAAQQQLTNGKVDLAQTLKATAISGAIGGAVPVAGAGLRGAKTVADNRVPLVQTETGSVSAGANAPVKKQLPQSKVKQSSLTKGAQQDRQNFSPELNKAVQGEYNVRNTQELADEASNAVNSVPTDQAIQSARTNLDTKLGDIDDKTVAYTQQAILKADGEGRLQDAIDLHDSLSEHLTKQGQSIQAASLFYNLSPDAMFYRATRDITKAGGKEKLTPELQQKLRDKTNELKLTTDPEAKKYIQAEISKLVSDTMPRKASQDLLSIWKAGLLSGVKTQTGNSASGLTFAGLRAVSNPVSAGVDKLISLKTGERTKTATLGGLGAGGIQGAKSGYKTLKSGIDVRNITGDKYEQFGEMNFNNPVLNNVLAKPTNFVFRSMSAGDQPYYYAALKNTMYDLAKADGLNKKLKGAELRDHMQQTVNDPPVALAEKAVNAAEKAVLGQDNKVASKISGLTREFPALGVLVPFVKVPTNFLLRSLDYTPVGAIKTIGQQIKNKSFDQRALSEALGEATTGTALIYLGAELANSDMLSGQYPKNDTEEAQRWKAEGITPNSLFVPNGKTRSDGKPDGNWVSLNYMGPLGLILGAGKDYQDAAKRGDSATMNAIAGAGKTLTGQSFLSGFSGFTNAINDPQRSAGNFAKSQAGSIVPSISNDVANLFDNQQRDIDNVKQAPLARLPGFRNGLPIKQTVYGQDLDQATDPINKLVNPGKPSKARTDDVLSEVARLKKVDPNNKDFSVTPTPVGKSVSFGGKDDKGNAAQTKLDAEQRRQLQKQVGQRIQSDWSTLIKTPEYQALSDSEKAAALDGVRKQSSKLAQNKFADDNKIARDKDANVKSLVDFTKTKEQLAADEKLRKDQSPLKRKGVKTVKATKGRTGRRSGGGARGGRQTIPKYQSQASDIAFATGLNRKVANTGKIRSTSLKSSFSTYKKSGSSKPIKLSKLKNTTKVRSA